MTHHILTCAHCRNTFSAARQTRRYCSQQCYHAQDRDRMEQGISGGIKTCAKCKEKKPRSEFSPASRFANGDGLHGYCKACRCQEELERRKNPLLVQKFHHKYETDMDFRAKQLLCAVQKRCRKNHWAYDLDAEWLAGRLRIGTCELTGLRFEMSVATRRPTMYTPSIDRIVPGSGYTKDNCRVVLHAINIGMLAYTLEAFLPIAQALVEQQCQPTSRVA